MATTIYRSITLPFSRIKQNMPNNGYSRPGYTACGSMVARDAKKALQLALAVKKLVNIEYKSQNVDFATPSDNSGDVQNITALAQGNQFNQRNGRKIKLFSFRLKGSVIQNTSAVNTTYRMLLVRDNLGNTTPPVITDLFASTTNMFGGRAHQDDPQTNSRFTVLVDKLYLLQNVGNQMVKFDIYRKISSHVTFTGTAATDEGKGALWLMTISNEATNTPAIIADSVVKYIDN